LQTEAVNLAQSVRPDNRRSYTRHAPVERAAVWFNTGIAIGETCELKDVSMSGFAINCDEWQLPVFLGTEGHSIYCVLLLGEAHFGCMAHVVETASPHSSRVGLHFDAVPENSIRLLQGLIDCMADREQSIRELQSRETASPE
jgi:hypothetical protein